jgi:hypothetical protein
MNFKNLMSPQFVGNVLVVVCIGGDGWHRLTGPFVCYDGSGRGGGEDRVLVVERVPGALLDGPPGGRGRACRRYGTGHQISANILSRFELEIVIRMGLYLL